MDKWTPEDIEFLRSNFASMSHEEIAKAIGSTRAAVRNKCYRLKLRKMGDFWTDSDYQKLKELRKIPDITLSEIANRMGRSEASVSLKISRSGLGYTKIRTKKPPKERMFSSEEELSKYKSEKAKKWIAENGHPRGALGMRHTEENKKKQSERSKRHYQSLTEEQKQAIVLKAMQTRVKNGTQFTERKNASWKAGWREIGGTRKYYRSNWEGNYACYLQWLKENGQIKDWLHEPVTFWFVGIKRGTVSYLPDFWVQENDGTEAYHEVKGWMDDRSKTKIARMARYHPNVKLIVIDGKAYHEIRKKVSSIIPGWIETQRDKRG